MRARWRSVRWVPIIGLDHVQVAAPPGCERDARGFYGALLGLAEVPKPEPLAVRGGVWFVRWDASLPGVARFYVDDPWGNRLELVEARP